MVVEWISGLVLAAAALPTAAPAPFAPVQAAQGPRSAFVQGTLNVAAGERVVLKLKPDGTFDLIEARVVGPEAALPPTPGTRVDMATLMQASPGTIAVTLGLRRDVGSFLKIENGLDRTFDYTGFIVRFVGGQARGPHRTSVCTVPAGKLGYEHWGEPVIQAVLGSLNLADGSEVVCESHDVNE